MSEPSTALTNKRGNDGLSPFSTVKGRIVAGFVLICLIFAAAIAGSTWQAQIYGQDLDELDRHAATATLLQESEAQAGISALLLQRYLVTGDESLIPEIQTHADASVESLTQAIAAGAPPAVDEAAVSGSSLTAGAAGVIALRQAGDLEGADANMELIVPIFREFRLNLEDATAQELAIVADLRVSANRAGDLSFIFLVVSGGLGMAMALLVSIFIARSIIKPLASLEETATAASQGDLSARAPVTGPRELAHLGAVFNEMIAAVESRTQQLTQAYDELKTRNSQLTDARAQALTDPLTGLGNHRSFHRRIREEIANVEDGKTPVSLILFDIDGFKSVNDTLGHLAGDELLRDLTSRFEPVVRISDAYRYGGDEFAVLLVGRDRREAMVIAEALRKSVAAVQPAGGQKLTVSLGVCAFPEMAASAEELIYRADMAMYWAKSTGKNRVGDWDGLISRRGDDFLPQYAGDRPGKSQDAVASLVSALNAKDSTTRDHTERCSWYATELAAQMGLDDQQTSILRLASLLHDIGKLVIPDDVLRKPGPLDADEWKVMREHPNSAKHILSQLDSAAEAVPAIVHHHERYDGTGYPDGLKGESIPLASRILTVTDAFDAMTSDRPYRNAMEVEDALDELKQNSGTQFDPEIVEAFVKLIETHGAHPLRPTSASAVPSKATSTADA